MVKTDLLFQKSSDTISCMKNTSNYKLLLTLALIFSGLFFSCQTAPKEISQDLTCAQLIQRGQDALANEQYKVADAYYVAAIDRYGADLKCYVEAKYELAHSFYKQKKYQMAKTIFNEIVDIFDSPDSVYKVQPKYKKLALIELAKIEEIESKQK